MQFYIFGLDLPSKTQLPSSKTMILSINSRKPVWWVAMILVVSFYYSNTMLNIVSVKANKNANREK